MREPRRLVSTRAMAAVVVTMAVTAPLLTLWSTTLLSGGADPNQFISLLGQHVAGRFLADYVAVPEKATEQSTTFRVRWYDHEIQQRAVSSLAGKHNILNALAALAAVHACNIPLESAIPALLSTLERRDAELRQCAVDVLAQILKHPIPFEAFASEATRKQQLVALRDVFERKAG